MQQCQAVDNMSIKFKFNSKVDVFKNDDQELFEQVKTGLVVASHLYGYVFVAYKNELKIYSTQNIESSSGHVAELMTQAPTEYYSQLQLNSDNSLLIILSARLDTLEQFINIFDVSTLNKKQAPKLLNKYTINPQPNQQAFSLMSIHASPCEIDVLALCMNNGVIKLIKFYNKTFKVSKNCGAQCIAWSPKGKQLVAFLENQHLLFLDNATLEEKSKVELPLDKSLNSFRFFNEYWLKSKINICACQNCYKLGPKLITFEFEVIGNEIFWYSTKQLFLTCISNQNQTEIFYIEISQKTSTVIQIMSCSDLLYESNTCVLYSTVFMCPFEQWQMLLFASSRCTDIGVLKKEQAEGTFDIQIIDDTLRASLPLFNDEDTFPIGCAVSFACQKEVELKPNVKVPPSPLLIFLNNVGQLVTFYVCNTQSPQSICKPSAQIIPQPRNINPEQPQQSQQQQQPQSVQQSFSFNLDQSQQTKQSLPNMQPLLSTPKNESTPKITVDTAKLQPAKQIEPNSQAPQRTTNVNILAHINAFTDELNAFKEKIKQNRLFSDKSMGIINSADQLKQQYKYLIDENLFKETNMIKQKFNDLNSKMKNFTDNCLDLRENLIANFDTLEKLKMYREHLTDNDYMSLLMKRDLNPTTKSRYDDIKNLFNYIDREIENINYLICEKNKAREIRLAELIPNERVFEILRYIDSSVNQYNKEINQIIARLKFMKLNTGKYKKYFQLQNQSQTDASGFDDNLSGLCDQLGNVGIHGEQRKSIGGTKPSEKQSASIAFYAQLHDILKKRKQIPLQNKNLYSLEFIKTKFDEERAVQIQGNLSFIASPQMQKPLQATQPLNLGNTILIKPANQNINEASTDRLNVPKFNLNPEPSDKTFGNQFLKSPDSTQIQFSSQSFAQEALNMQTPTTRSQLFSFSASTPSIVTMVTKTDQANTPTSSTFSFANPTTNQPTGTINIQKNLFSAAKNTNATQQQTMPNQTTGAIGNTTTSLSSLSFTQITNMQSPQQSSDQKQNKSFAFAQQPSTMFTQSASVPVLQNLLNEPQKSVQKSQLPANTASSFAGFSFNLGASTQQPTSTSTSTATTTTQAKQASSTFPGFSFDKIASTTQNITSTPATSADTFSKFSFGADVLKTDLQTATPESNKPTFSLLTSTKPSLIEPSVTTTSAPAMSTPSLASTAIGAEPKPNDTESTTKQSDQQLANQNEAAATSKKDDTKPTETIPKFTFNVAPSNATGSTVTPSFSFTSTTSSDKNGIGSIAPSFSFSGLTSFATDKNATIPKTTSLMTDNKTPVTTGIISSTTTTISQTAPIFSFTQQQPTTTTTTTPQTFPLTQANPTTVTSLFGSTAPTTTTAVPVQTSNLFFNLKPDTDTQSVLFKSQQVTPNDDDMESNQENNTNTALGGFGGLGFGTTTKPTVTENKNLFSNAIFGSSGQQASAQKSPFSGGQASSGGLLKGATFNFSTDPTATSTPQASTQNNLFSSFTSPQKPVFGSQASFGGATTFGGGATATPAFGGAPTFGGQPTFGATPVFGSSTATSPQANLFGSTSSSSVGFGSAAHTAPLFGSLASGNQPAFGSASSQSTSFGFFGANNTGAQNPSSNMSFGVLAQQSQQPQQPLFSNFSSPTSTTAPAFGSPNNQPSSSFTAYRK